MSTNHAVIKLCDGSVLFTTYQDTSDTLCSVLYATPDIKRPSNVHHCTCGQKPEPAIAATWGMQWAILVCRECMAVVYGAAPYGIEGWGGGVIEKPVNVIYDEPEWFKGSLLKFSSGL